MPKPTPSYSPDSSGCAPILPPDEIQAELLLVTCFFLAFTLGWNNSGLTTGNLSNLLTYQLGLVITVAGLLLGCFLEGAKTSNSVLGKLVPTSSISLNDVTVGLAVAFAFFAQLTVVRIPVSLSNCVVGGFLGVGLASGAGFDEFSLIEILSSWIAAPFLCAIFTVLIYELAVRQESRFSLVTVSWVNRILLTGIVFYVAYGLGANSLGLILSFIRTEITSNQALIVTEIGIYLAMIAGTLLFGKTLAKIVGEKIVG